MKKIIFALVAFAMMAMPMAAKKTKAATEENTQRTTTEAAWFLSVDYSGFTFELPAGCIVEKGSTLTARYTDGTFGFSVSNQESIGLDQDRAFQLCRMQASQLELKDTDVKRIEVDGVKGARAIGTLNSQSITIIILPYSDQQLTAIIINSPSREEWRNHLLNTIKH